MTTPTSRLLELLSLLQARRDWPGAVLAERLGISHRTVRRDVERLREMGYRIEATMGPDGGYRLDAGAELPPLLFDDDQVIALAVALQSATASGVGIEEAAVRALTTVRQVMPSRLRHRLDALSFTALPAGTVDAVAPGVLTDVSTAIRAREVLRFDYARDAVGTESAEPTAASRTPPAPPRRVEPHHLLTSAGRWYLVAFDLDRDDWRIFRMDRVAPRTPSGPRFAPRQVPGGDPARYVAARFKGSARADRWPCEGEVIVQLPAARVIPFAGDGVVEPLGEDRCRLRLGAWSWMALAAAFARFDAELEVVSPPELADAFAQLAARAARVARAAEAGGRQPAQ